MKTKRSILLALLILFSTILFEIACSSARADNIDKEVKQEIVYDNFIYDPVIYDEGWHKLPQTIFWQNVMELTPDSAVVNVSTNREIIDMVDLVCWHEQTDSQKTVFKDSIKNLYCIPDSVEIYITKGKSNFYKLEDVKPLIKPSIYMFDSVGVDPWYAQAILLIESPGKTHQKSPVGANGPFQLMRSVARLQGIVVNSQVDERTDIHKAAFAAARLLKTICIPKVKEMLDVHDVVYKETDLWFRLLVLHAYHAGAGNLGGVIRKIQPTEGGMALMDQVWHTTYRGFKNSSQNYSQLALAAYCNFHQIVEEEESLRIIRD